MGGYIVIGLIIAGIIWYIVELVTHVYCPNEQCVGSLRRARTIPLYNFRGCIVGHTEMRTCTCCKTKFIRSVGDSNKWIERPLTTMEKVQQAIKAHYGSL